MIFSWPIFFFFFGAPQSPLFCSQYYPQRVEPEKIPQGLKQYYPHQSIQDSNKFFIQGFTWA